jgi:hypothetical protein
MSLSPRAGEQVMTRRIGPRTCFFAKFQKKQGYQD